MKRERLLELTRGDDSESFDRAIDVQIHRLRRLIEYRNASQGRGPRRAQVLEHLEILDAVAANDRKKAAALMRAHLAGALREKVLPDNLLA